MMSKHGIQYHLLNDTYNVTTYCIDDKVPKSRKTRRDEEL